MTNPLLDFSGLPRFGQIEATHVIPAIEHLLSENRQQLIDLLADSSTVFTWDNLLQVIQEMDDRLNRAWSPVSHLNSVKNSDELRAAYEHCLPLLSDYHTEIGQNNRLYQAIKSIIDSDQYDNLSPAQKKILQNKQRDFHLSGIDLDDHKKNKFKQIRQQLSKLKSSYENNVLDATNGWDKRITHKSQLSGLPESALAMAKQTAELESVEGWVFNLQFPSYFAIMTHADQRELREEFYTAYCTRASDQGPNAGQWDNTDNMERIMALRQKLAQLLDFNSYAEYSLATKMADSTNEVIEFLQQLAEKSKAVALQDIAALKAFAAKHLGIDDIQAWDLNYAAEKLRQHQYDLSQEALKPYFPENQVINGLFAIVKRLYGIEITAVSGVETWHPDVRFYEIKDARGLLRGQFYLDLYARPHKRGGAWMDECIVRYAHQGMVQIPVAYLTCNLTPPIGDEPTLFTHDEVNTLFHEFGHGLHHMLTQVDYAAVSGINGVPWDAVELPSQFMENWCWEKESLNLIARHYQTGEALPDEIFAKMTAAKNFQSGLQMLRQLEFALFDFKLHIHYQCNDQPQVQKTLDETRQQISVFLPPEFNRFQHGFSHIFSGGYAAGYYSYKWAEVLSADAFSLFEENGIFDQKTGEQFLHTILEMGGVEEPMDLFQRFRGRKPNIDALLRHSGITL
ncbi:MAG: oligopeptidase A [gamma proteobacterium symbiont of Bathyaustriella thionipta]|nr:oligopeptidase A [gamma proteobacterium symbiont of Bathyaustriella thionipta]MCU7951282.1 oligopeptidase A [gamma proteobacterium symbiont of Bathyaustriella thionipta]MCU7954335.1 oligopeptidase A [gamma proteobacterium symbiont of Bathyaustriella thionipta]MCU7957815.1 oligopeptidase A [gamma proteobacterium symbiont of Bathyaustriella thionipta]MCU7965894.1 oligopeptidase A [gamma proteobacterium symbiont of Bathyaustriella thionipta]